MLDTYKETQKKAYKLLKNAIKKEKYSHAYLFEIGDFYDSHNFIMSFVKELLCPNKNANKECSGCNICEMIDNGNFPEIKIINPDGMWIKKEQISELQEEFKKKPVFGNKKIYVINEAEKLNKQSANSILKFLEEPEEGIIAILVTKNSYQVLETIRSRCQIIKLEEDKYDFTDQTTNERLSNIFNTDEETLTIIIDKVINFINYYEKNHFDTIIYMQKLWHESIKTKEELIMGFEIMIMFYKEVLNYLTNNKIEIFVDHVKSIEYIAKNNNIKSISTKINIIDDQKDKIKYNANTNLLMDKLIIELEGGI